MDRTTAYARLVTSGKEIAGPWVRLACERHLRDLKRKDLTWDVEKAERAIQFFSDCLTLEGGVPFDLQPFQAFIVGSCFGWYLKGWRRFRTAYVETGKGSGKTPLAAGIGLLGLVADGEPNAEIYSAASTQDQASISFRDAKRMVEDSEELRDRVDVQVGNLTCGGSVFRPVSAEHRGLDGKRVHIGLLDELHEHPSPLVVDKIRAGTKTRKNALIFEITNSGHDRTSVCYAHHEMSLKVLQGVVKNDAWFAYVAALDEGDDWRDPKVWKKANPGIGVILPERYLREQVEEAQGMPSKENIVKRLNFCIWTEQSTRWLPMDQWDRGAKPVQVRDGATCVGGLDLASVSDFAAICLDFPPEDADGVHDVIWRFWVPEEKANERIRKGFPLDVWERNGSLKFTPGNVTDYSFIEAEILKLAEKYRIKAIAFDRWNASDIVTRLKDRLGEDRLIDYGQGYASMSAPSKELERLVKDSRLRHGGDPVARWMASNVCTEEDAAGNIKPSKGKSGEKIDGIVALVMALGVAIKGGLTEKRSVYEERGFIGIGFGEAA